MVVQVVQVVQVLQYPTQLQTGWQVQLWVGQPVNGLHVQVLVLQTESQVHTMLQLQLLTGTQVHTELHEQVPPPVGGFSSGCIKCISLSGILISTVCRIFGSPFAFPLFCSRSLGRCGIFYLLLKKLRYA
jgi:hypothetical protein